MIIAGIDLSMTAPAICIQDTNDPDEFQYKKFYVKSSGPKKHLGKYGNIQIDAPLEFSCPEERYLDNARWVMNILESNGVQEVVLEGYSMGSTKGLIFNIAENTAVLKQKLYLAGIPFTTPAPTQTKKAFTGKGNADKPTMCETFYERYKVRPHIIIGCGEAKSPENDMVDANANMLMHRLMVRS